MVKYIKKMQTTIFQRCVKDVKEALNIFCIKNMNEEAVQVALELFESNLDKYVLEKLMLIAVEEKFPNGSQYLPWFKMSMSSWKKFSYKDKRLFIIEITNSIALCKGDRHVTYLTRLAEEKCNDSNEETLASKIQVILDKYRMKCDFPTNEDFSKKNVIQKLKKLIFQNEIPNPIQKTLWDIFEHSMDTRINSRSFLYTLVAMKFHLHQYLPCKRPSYLSDVKTTKICLPDFVYTKNTKKGKEMKRGLKHLLETYQPEIVHKNAKNREDCKRKAETFILENEHPFPRKKKRLDFIHWDKFYDNYITSSEVLKEPTSTSPGSWLIQTNKKYVFYGPYENYEKVKFQVDSDNLKEKLNISKTGYKIYKNNFYWLYHPYVEYNKVSPQKNYSDTDMHQLIKIFLFRAEKGMKSDLKSILHLKNGKFISINDTPHKIRTGTLLNYFFSKIPSKAFLSNMMVYIYANYDKVDLEFKKYNCTHSLKNFNLNNIKIN